MTDEARTLRRFKEVFTAWYGEQMESGKTRVEISRMLNVTAPTIDKWVQADDIRLPSCENLLKIAEALGCTVDYLIRPGAPRTRDPQIREAMQITGLTEDAVLALTESCTAGERAAVSALLEFHRKKKEYYLYQESADLISLMEQYFQDCTALFRHEPDEFRIREEEPADNRAVISEYKFQKAAANLLPAEGNEMQMKETSRYAGAFLLDRFSRIMREEGE